MTKGLRALPILVTVFILLEAGAVAEKPSTPEERAQAVRLARELEAQPTSDDAVEKRRWLITWYERVPDISIIVCDLLGPFPGSEHPYFSQVLVQSMFAGGAFMIEHPDQANDQIAVQTAGMESALKVYEEYLKQMPDTRVPFLDELLQKRDSGTLADHMREAVPDACDVSPADHSVPEERVTASVSMPQSIGELSFDKVREPAETDLSTQIVYKAPGMTLTIIIYGGGTDLPDGISSERFKTEFKQAQVAVLSPQAWDKAKLVGEETVELGTAPNTFPAQEARFKITDEGQRHQSYLWLTAFHRVFFKARFTVASQQEESGKEHLPLIRSAFGQLIGAFIADSE